MSEQLVSMRLDADSQLLLDQPLLRLPHELLRKNLKTAQRNIEMVNKNVTTTIQSSGKGSEKDTLASLDSTLLKAQNLKRKLEALHAEEQILHRQQRARIQHIQLLHEINTLADVKYDQWAHTRLDRLLVDYLLRQGHIESARALASEKGIEELVDIAVFEECGRIETSLAQGRVQECLAWCVDNKQALKKINSNLELELRLQQFIELARTGDVSKLMEAIMHARKHLAGGQDAEFGLRAGGLLAYPPNTMIEPYREMYSSGRYTHLKSLFLKTHHELFSLPAQPLIHTALSAGLSALKTPTCHSIHNALHTQNQPENENTSKSFPVLTGTPVCPICSTELNDLARDVPYAHHTQSSIEEDPVVLPNGRIYGRARLKALNDKLGVSKGTVRDPTDPKNTEWNETELRKIYIS